MKRKRKQKVIYLQNKNYNFLLKMLKNFRLPSISFTKQLSVQSATSTEIESNIEEREGSWYSDDFGSSSTSEMAKRKLEKSRRLGVEFEGQLKNLTHLLHIITEVGFILIFCYKILYFLIPGIAELLRDSTKKEDHIVLRIINKMKMIKGFHAADLEWLISQTFKRLLNSLLLSSKMC